MNITGEMVEAYRDAMEAGNPYTDKTIRHALTAALSESVSPEQGEPVAVTEPQPIETYTFGNVVLAHEPMYGWLMVYSNDGKNWMLKSTGNFWEEVPASIKFTHWVPAPQPLWARAALGKEGSRP